MEYVEVARAESERGEVVLRERRDPDEPTAAPVLELRVNGVFVMDTHETSTERQLAAAALAQVGRPHDVLIGGLGLGFTLHEVLADHAVERVVVVEIEDALVRWMRDGTIPHGPSLLADERLHLVVAAAPPGIGDYSIRLRTNVPTTNPGRIIVKSSAGGQAGPFTVSNG